MTQTDPAAQTSVREELWLSSRDGTLLFSELTRATNPRAGVLVVHGYFEHGGRYGELCELLANWGFTSIALDLRGHGRSAGRRGYVRSFMDYIEDLEAAWKALAEIPGATPRFLICHSAGALAGLRWLADPFRRPPDVAGLVASSPFLGLKIPIARRKRWLATVASRLLPTLSLPGDLDVAWLSRDPDKQAERLRDALCHNSANARWFIEARNTQEWVNRYVHRVETPTLWLVGEDDKVADPDITLYLHGKIAARSAFHAFPDMRHEVFNELGRTEVFAVVRRFLETT